MSGVSQAETIVVALSLAAATGSALTAFALVGATLTLLLILVYIGTCASCISFYLRKRRDEFNRLLHLVLPAAGIAMFIPVLMASLGIDFAGLGITPLSYPVSLAPWIVGAWLALGGLYFGFVRPRRPEAIEAMGRVFGSGEEPEPAAGRARALE